MPYLPALRDLVKDAELTGSPTRVYLFLMEELDPVDYRPVKAWAVAQHLGMKEHTVGRALKLLVERGYLSKRWEGEGKAVAIWYRIVHVRGSGGLSPERQKKAS
jgi:hypothetical protein